MGLLDTLRRFYTIPEPDTVEQRNWLTDDDALWDNPMTNSGIRVGRETAMRLSTVWACVRLLSNTIATLPTEIVVRIGGARFPEYNKPSWLVTPYPADPTLTPTDFFGQVATSMLLEGNAFVIVQPSVMDPQALWVVDPSRVDIKRNDSMQPVYEIRDEYGQVRATLDAMQMLHATWIKLPGQLRGLSPLEAARQGLGLSLVAEEFGSRYFGQGSALSFGVEVPGGLTEEQKEELRRQFKRQYEGVRRSHAIGVLTGGAKFVTGLGVTNEQAQFLELRKFQVEDIARFYGIPPHMVGSQEPGASSYSSVEQRSLEFREYAVLPLVRRIEDPFQRLVQVPANLRSTTATASFRFNLDGIARADTKSRFEAYQSGITAGILKPNEARALEDLPPVPGGEVTYMQSQMVPTGTLPAATVARDEQPLSITNNMSAETLKVESIKPPDVRIEPAVVNVAQPVTEVTVHNDLTPIADAIRELHLGKPTRRFVRRDERGRIIEIVDYPEGQEMVS